MQSEAEPNCAGLAAESEHSLHALVERQRQAFGDFSRPMPSSFVADSQLTSQLGKDKYVFTAKSIEETH